MVENFFGIVTYLFVNAIPLYRASCVHQDEVYLVDFVRRRATALEEVESGNLTTGAYSAVAKCTKLKELWITSTDELEDSHLEELVKNASNLESLKF